MNFQTPDTSVDYMHVVNITVWNSTLFKYLNVHNMLSNFDINVSSEVS